MNKNLVCLLLLLVMACSLVAMSCAGPKTSPPASSNSTAASGSTPSEAPQINMPSTNKSQLPIIQFTVSPNNIAPGGTAVLSWTVTNATSASIDHGIGTISMTGTKSVSPTTPTTYKLTALNDSGSMTRLVSLAVTQAAPSAPATKPPSK
jgi:hypothetical protein